MKRILVAGAGLIGARHLKMVQDHPNCQLAGLVDPDESRHSDEYACYSDLADVSDQADGVILATPTSLHADQGIYAAQRGWDMLIEKPVADTAESAHILSVAARSARVRSLVGHHRRYHPSLQLLRKMLADGTIGQLVTATVIWVVKKPDDYFQDNWRTGEGSPIMINLVHDIDVLRFLMGEVEDAIGFGSNAVRKDNRIESGAVALRMTSGATIAVSFADTAISPWGFEAGTCENPNIAGTGQDMMWITGTKGSVSFPSLTVWTGARDWSQAPSSEQVSAPTIVPLRAQLDHFIEVMEGKAEPLIDIDDATRSLEATLKVQRALRL